MKAANMKGKNGGDDLILNRLLTRLNRSLPFTIHEIRRIRDYVYHVDTDEKPLILKGFSSLSRLRLQEAFTTSLKSEGFHNTYSFYRFMDQPIYFNKKYYGMIEFIEAHPDPLTYRSQNDRLKALDLLYEYHATTKQLTIQYEKVIPRLNLIEKWQERTNRFIENLPIIRYYLEKPVIEELLLWSNDSLAGMSAENVCFKNEQSVILHGDVAHHNFLKSRNGPLYLIDFDLIMIGDESTDLLQFSNRILPFIDWSLERLGTHPSIQAYLNNQAFLWALMYPSDIFREWNRIIKDKAYQNPSKLLVVMDLTMSQFHLRQQFIKVLRNVVK